MALADYGITAPRELHSADELDGLPEGSVIIDSHRHESWTKGDDGWYWAWYEFGMRSDEVPLPVMLVWRPQSINDARRTMGLEILPR